MRCLLIASEGVLKTYKLIFESCPAQHALFRKDEAVNHWSIASRTLREFVEHFGPKTDQLDIYCEGGKANFTSYTEKIMSGMGRSLFFELLMQS
jgi:cell cycle checkpoint control protein RAD9A